MDYASTSAFLVLKESELWPEYQARVEKFYPSLQSSSDYLLSKREELIKHDHQTPNRLFIDADALFLTARLLEKNPPSLARELRDMGLKLFDPDTGAFLENGGGDSSYQAVNLKMLMLYVTYYPTPDINRTIRKGMDWELSRISPDGSISVKGNSRTGVGKEMYFGHPKEVNYREVIEMFAYAGQLYDDARYTATAQLVDRYRRQ